MSGRLSSPAVWKAAEVAVVAGDVAILERLLRDYADVFSNEPRSWWDNTLAPDYRADDARAIISRTHHFDSWQPFEAFMKARAASGSPVALFETAVDAVVAGDLDALRALLRGHPELTRARSLRNHHATLLHYVGANGVEGFRQYTPPAAVGILELLLAAGAEVDSVAEMYGGSTTLGLIATSRHPERAGLQQVLIDVLLAQGAGMDVDTAARVGRIDRLTPPATDGQLASALVSAAARGQHVAVRFLLDHGVPVDARSPVSRFTGANWAALNGDMALLQLFIARGADLEIENDYGGTALGGALWGAVHRPPLDAYPAVIGALVAAGATVESGSADWWEKQEPRSPDAHARILSLLRAHERLT